MSRAITTSTGRLVPYRVTNLSGLTLEGEIRSLCTLAPETVSQLPSLFSQSVVESCTNVAGPSAGEALVRRIGDERLQDPREAYARIDALLHGGSDTLKEAIEQRFRNKVHRLYRISMKIEERSLTVFWAGTSV